MGYRLSSVLKKRDIFSAKLNCFIEKQKICHLSILQLFKFNYFQLQ